MSRRGAAGNRLIAQLPRRDRLSLLAACESVTLELGSVLFEPGKPTRHVYFPDDGFISLVAPAVRLPFRSSCRVCS